MTKTIALLGATGSIGRQTLEVAGELGLRVAALTANTQVDLLEQQYMPRLAVLYDENAALALKKRLRGTGIEVMAGEEGLLAAAAMTEADTVVTAVMGSVGLRPTLAAIQKGKRIALANKETLVCAGELVMDVGTMLDGKKAVKEKLIDQLGGISDALDWLYREIERAE